MKLGLVDDIKKHSARRTRLFLHVNTSLDHLMVITNVTYLIAYGTSAATNTVMILPVSQETSGGVLSATDTVVQQHDHFRWLHNYDEDDETELCLILT